MTEQNNKPLDSTSTQTTKHSNRWGYGIAIIVLMCLFIWFGIRINALTQQTNQIQEVTKTNSQQLINFNQILGRALDVQAENSPPSPIDIKITLEIFEKLNSLNSQVELLPIKPQEQNPVQDNSRAVTSNAINPAVNAEMRWWSKVGQYVWNPLTNYLTNLIKIQTLDSNLEYLAMSPASQNIIREELRIRILTARALLLSGLIPQTTKEISQVKKILEKNFLPNDGSTQKTMEDIQAVLANLHELEKKNAQLALPAGDKK